MDVEIKHAIDAVRADLRKVDGHLSVEIRQVEASLRQEIREDRVAARRRFDDVESLRDDLRIIAEGLISLDAKVEGMKST